MHYRNGREAKKNGREAKNGDRIVSMMNGGIDHVGYLYGATPGDDYCNGYIMIAVVQHPSDPVACMCDCLHVDDVMEILAEKGLDKRPEGK